jgi:hypothetical protein
MLQKNSVRKCIFLLKTENLRGYNERDLKFTFWSQVVVLNAPNLKLRLMHKSTRPRAQNQPLKTLFLFFREPLFWPRQKIQRDNARARNGNQVFDVKTAVFKALIETDQHLSQAQPRSLRIWSYRSTAQFLQKKTSRMLLQDD